MRSTPSIRHFPNVAFETVPLFVWLMTGKLWPHIAKGDKTWVYYYELQKFQTKTKARVLKGFLLRSLEAVVLKWRFCALSFPIPRELLYRQLVRQEKQSAPSTTGVYSIPPPHNRLGRRISADDRRMNVVCGGTGEYFEQIHYSTIHNNNDEVCNTRNPTRRRQF